MQHRVTYSCLVVIVVAISSFTVVAQQPNATDEDTAVGGIVDGIIKPFLSQHHIPGAIVGVSLRGKEYFFPMERLRMLATRSRSIR
jgi:hypothetical protein